MGDTVKVKLRVLVEGDRALETLATMGLAFKASYAVSKALGIARREVDTYKKGITTLMREKLKVKPAPDGSMTLDSKKESYDKDLTLLQKHQDSVLDGEVELTGIIMVKLDDLEAALLGTPKLDKDGERTGEYENPVIAPWILIGCGWFITD